MLPTRRSPCRPGRGRRKLTPRIPGTADSLGTVEEGKLADLVLLEANPLEDIRNTRPVHGVVRDGRYLDRTWIDATFDVSLP